MSLNGPKSDEQQATYANGLLSGFLERQRLKQAAHFVQAGSNVLDLACNEGALLTYLPTNIHYIGIDISDRAIARATKQYPQHTFKVADLTKPNTEMLDGIKFDVIVMLAFLEHIDNPGDLLKTYAAYLKPKGMIVVTTPAPIGRRIHDVGAQVGLFSKHAAKEHETFLGRQNLAEIAHSANLQLYLYRRFLLGFNQLACFTLLPQ